jgi:hypothetical protein
MRTPIVTAALALSIALVGCGDNEAATATATASTDTDASTTTTTSADTSTGADTSATSDTSTGTESSTSGGEASSTSEGYTPPSYEDYCACMLDACHDLYHSTWGENHVLSEMECLASAAESPSAGMATMEGNSIECRMHFCELAAETADMSVCDSAIGGGACQ